MSIEILKNRLTGICRLELDAQSKLQTGWNGQGKGKVKTVTPSPDSLLFYESGQWSNQAGQTFDFTNVYRWSFEPHAVKLEHLRFGIEHPAYLFHLIPGRDGNDHLWSSAAVHQCQSDAYTAQLMMEDQQLVFLWKITGPKKDERLTYRYSS